MVNHRRFSKLRWLVGVVPLEYQANQNGHQPMKNLQQNLHAHASTSNGFYSLHVLFLSGFFQKPPLKTGTTKTVPAVLLGPALSTIRYFDIHGAQYHQSVYRYIYIAISIYKPYTSWLAPQCCSICLVIYSCSE